MVRAAADAVASLLFPAPCRICETLLDAASRIPICRACLEAMGPLPGPVCDRCGRPFPSLMTAESGPRQCLACRRGLYDFDLARSYADYNHTMARAVMLLKYSAVEPLAGWFADRLGELISLEPRLMEVDMVVPVPLDAARLRERGYNQAERIARPLARRLGLPLKPVLLLRKRPRPAKLKLTRRERWT
ncbi:MAG TPA: double zinc ribbon domain-containing protein, partial [Candidatus Acidoferrales bacterium]